jgi:four helix bundle protein
MQIAIRKVMSGDRFRDLRDRSFAFAVDTCRFCRGLTSTWEGRLSAGQLFRAATGMACNYRAAGQGRSNAEFIAKLGTVVEEADESCFWYEFVEAAEIAGGPVVRRLGAEATELRRIFGASLRTARTNAAAERDNRRAALERERQAKRPIRR